MNAPNAITLIRLLIAVAGFIFMFLDQWFTAGILILVAVVLDIADGLVARKFGHVTKQGVFLDVMADKIVIISTFLIIGLKIEIIFFYLGLLMLAREYAIDTMRSVAATKNIVISADKFSKIKGVLFMIAMLGMIWDKIFFQNDRTVQYAMIGIASLAMILAYITLARFFIKHKSILFS